MKINIRDGLFFNSKSFNDIYGKSNFFEWERISVKENDYLKESFINENKVLFFTEIFFKESHLISNKYKKVGIILEPKGLRPENYNIEKFKNNFDYILTYDKDLVDNEKVLFFAFGGCWVKSEDRKIYHKNKMISATFSNKNETEGHRMRHEIFKNFKNKGVAFFGDINGNRINYKLESLKDFRYQIVVENCKQNDYFSEKIIDCFVTGTIPIYYGTDNIGKYFNENGIYSFNSIDELKNILSNINEKSYKDKLDFIEDNFSRSKEYLTGEDWIYKKYPFLFND